MRAVIKKTDVSDAMVVRRMWEESFPDGTPEYADWYFGQVYSHDRTLCMYEDGELVSNLQMIPYLLRFRGRQIVADTLTGVVTGPEYRNRGFAKTLMAGALCDMSHRGLGFTFLYPFNHSFYARLGWEICSAALEYLVPTAEMPDSLPRDYEVKTAPQPDIATFSAIYDSYMAGRNCCAVRGEADWLKRIGENSSLGGFILAAYRRGEPAAYAFCEEQEREIDIGELAYDRIEAVSALLAALKPRGKPVCWTAPEDDRAYLLAGRLRGRVKLQPHVMFRVTDVPLAFQQTAPACDGELVVEITGDNMRPEINGRYLLRAKDGSASALRTDAEPQFNCNIGTLAGILTGFVDAGEAVSAGLAQGTGEAVDLLNNLYPKQKNFIFELY